MPSFLRPATALLALTIAGSAAATAVPHSLRQAVHDGAALFASGRFGSTRTYTPLNGFDRHALTCQACHSDGGIGPGQTPAGVALPSLEGAAAGYPKLRAGRVVTLEQQIGHCIAAGIGGQPPRADSAAMTDLVAYLSALSRGRAFATQLPAP